MTEPSRPPNLRHLSEDLQTYIDLYGLSADGDLSNAHDRKQSSSGELGSEHDFLFSGDVDEELKNLQNLRRISLDVANVDPDLPSQNYELKPALQTQNEETEADNAANSLFWVPARIHPEIAPQEWQSFVQKRGELSAEDDTAYGPFRAPSLKRGLSRSRSLLSREVGDRGLEKYTDAGPELERRRSKLRSQIKVADLENVTTNGEVVNTNLGLQNLVVSEEPAQDFSTDEPILVPPPGQILRRAARTGKGKGSYRKFAKPKNPSEREIDLENDENRPPLPPPSAAAAPRFESETIYLRDDAPSPGTIQAPTKLIINQSVAQDQPLERTKSRNRAVQIVGPKSPIETSSNEVVMPLAAPPIEEPKLQRPSTTQELPPDIIKNDNRIPAPSSLDTTATKPAISSAPPGHPGSTLPAPSVVQMDAKDPESPRPGLKRELSAASLTRAVMSGAAPGPATNNAQIANRRQPQEEQNHVATTTVAGKKSAWGKLFSTEDKSRVKKEVKSSSKMKRTPSQEDRSTHEKDAGSNNLFSSIFGNKKKEKDLTLEVSRRSSNPNPKPAVQEPRFYARYPIQLERAIYRMAHLKLGNSRRPLFHQVLLSNFMYGYLALVGANTSGQAQGPGRRNRSQGSAQRSPSPSKASRDSHENNHRDSSHSFSNHDRPRTADSMQSINSTASSDDHTSRTSTLDPGGNHHSVAEPARGRLDPGSQPDLGSEPRATSKNGTRMQRPGPVRRTGSMDVNEFSSTQQRTGMAT